MFALNLLRPARAAMVLAATFAQSAAAGHVADALIPPETGGTMTVLGIAIRELSPAAGPGLDAYGFEALTPPGLGAPPHVHANEDEVVFVVDGSYDVLLGETGQRVGPGGVLVMPRGIPHAFTNASDAPGTTVWVVSPDTSFRAFFAELAALPDGPPDMEAVAAIFAAHDITLLPPTE